MAVNVGWENTGNVLIANVSGRVDSSNAVELQSALDARIGSGNDSLLLDFENLAFISSAGLRVGLAVAKRMREEGRKFGICNPSASVGEVIDISGFDQIISVYASRAEALGAVESGQKEQSGESMDMDLRRSVDMDIVSDNIEDIAKFAVEKYEFRNNVTLSADVRDAHLQQVKDALWTRIEKLRKFRSRILADLFETASTALEDAINKQE